MKYLKILPFFLLMLTIRCLLSCKKKSGNSSASYKLATVDVAHSDAILHYRMVYDAYNNVDSMVIVGGGTDTGYSGFKSFNYFGSSYSILDASGFIVGVQASTTGVIIGVDAGDTTSFIYNGSLLGEKEKKVTLTTYPFYAKIDTNYAWNNGDMVSISFSTGTDSVDYNTGKSGQVGDAIRIDEFLAYGRPYIKTSHLPVQMTSSGNWLEKYFYLYDGQGRISQLVKVRNNNGSGADDSTFYTYQYYEF